MMMAPVFDLDDGIFDPVEFLLEDHIQERTFDRTGFEFCYEKFSEFDDVHLYNLVKKYIRENTKDYRYHAACAVFTERVIKSHELLAKKSGNKL